MTTCRKCEAQAEDGASFCENCGAKLDETVFCAECGARIEGGSLFCESCGAAIGEPTKKKFLKKIVLFGALIALIIATILFIVFLFRGWNAETGEYALYLKDGEIYYTDFNKLEEKQLTAKLVTDDSYDDYIFPIAEKLYSEERAFDRGTTTLDSFCKKSKDGKYVFFADKINEDGISLYYKRIGKKDEEAVKIDSDAFIYFVNDDATKVTYMKKSNSAAMLYQYDMNSGDKEKLCEDVEYFEVSEDGKRIGYVNTDGGLYLKCEGEEKAKIAGNVKKAYFTTGVKHIYYVTDENGLFKMSDGKESFEIAEDVGYVEKVYDSGEIYYVKYCDGEEVIPMDYIQDDMKEADAAMTPPDRPQLSYFDEEYEMAWAEYEVAKEAYAEKLRRDDLRHELKQPINMYDSMNLYYYDGSQEVMLAENIGSCYGWSEVTPIMAFYIYSESKLSVGKLSQIEDAEDFKDELKDLNYGETTTCIAVGGNVETLNTTMIPTTFNFSDDGKEFYFCGEEDETVNVYKIKVSEGKTQASELYDTNLAWFNTELTSDGQLVYFKDDALYINKKKIDNDVIPELPYVRYFKEFKRFVYYVDWDNNRVYGTLKIYEDGKATRIANDVHEYTVMGDGSILYLADYSVNSGNGDLYIYKNGKSGKLAGDVSDIVSPFGSELTRDFLLRRNYY